MSKIVLSDEYRRLNGGSVNQIKSNPGLWVARCHITERCRSGVMFSFSVVRDWEHQSCHGCRTDKEEEP